MSIFFQPDFTSFLAIDFVMNCWPFFFMCTEKGSDKTLDSTYKLIEKEG